MFFSFSVHLCFFCPTLSPKIIIFFTEVYVFIAFEQGSVSEKCSKSSLSENSYCLLPLLMIARHRLQGSRYFFSSLWHCHFILFEPLLSIWLSFFCRIFLFVCFTFGTLNFSMICLDMLLVLLILLKTQCPLIWKLVSFFSYMQFPAIISSNIAFFSILFNFFCNSFSVYCEWDFKIMLPL